jgi:N,N'-diacetyllegionaminate synthase
MKVEIIAEIAQGYEGNPKLAKLLVKGAILANADSVKMQLVFADELCVPTYPYYDLFRSLEMEIGIWISLVDIVHQAEKKIYLDVYGFESLKVALELKVDGVKISTTDFYNFPLVKKVFSSFDTVFLSTGGVPVNDVEDLLKTFSPPKNLTLLHGFQAEPTEIADNNLNRIASLRKRFPGVKIGFMDHSLGSDEEAFSLPMIALGLGVNSIEKHITLDYTLEIEDYISALSIDKFKTFVNLIRKMEPALGSSELILTEKEMEYKKKAGKIPVASQDLKAGDLITDSNIVLKRFSTIPSDEYYSKINDVIGKNLSSDIQKDQPFRISNLK